MRLAESFVASRPPCHPMLLPADPTEEELARDWTLSLADKLLVLHCHGEAHRLSFALQLCALRTYGRFVKDYETVPVRILNHLGRQLGLAPVLFLAPPHREATDLDHERRISRVPQFSCLRSGRPGRTGTLAVGRGCGGTGRCRTPASRRGGAVRVEGGPACAVDVATAGGFGVRTRPATTL